jgi:hypothetical protein
MTNSGREEAVLPLALAGPAFFGTMAGIHSSGGMAL